MVSLVEEQRIPNPLAGVRFTHHSLVSLEMDILVLSSPGILRRLSNEGRNVLRFMWGIWGKDYSSLPDLDSGSGRATRPP